MAGPGNASYSSPSSRCNALDPTALLNIPGYTPREPAQGLMMSYSVSFNSSWQKEFGMPPIKSKSQDNASTKTEHGSRC